MVPSPALSSKGHLRLVCPGNVQHLQGCRFSPTYHAYQTVKTFICDDRDCLRGPVEASKLAIRSPNNRVMPSALTSLLGRNPNRGETAANCFPADSHSNATEPSTVWQKPRFHRRHRKWLGSFWHNYIHQRIPTTAKLFNPGGRVGN